MLFFSSYGKNAWLLLTCLKACDWSRHIFGAGASPRPLTQKVAMSPSSTVHGGQHNAKYDMWMSSCYCTQHSWLAKFGVLCLNQLVSGRRRQKMGGSFPASRARISVSRLTTGISQINESLYDDIPSTFFLPSINAHSFISWLKLLLFSSR